MQNFSSGWYLQTKMVYKVMPRIYFMMMILKKSKKRFFFLIYYKSILYKKEVYVSDPCSFLSKVPLEHENRLSLIPSRREGRHCEPRERELAWWTGPIPGCLLLDESKSHDGYLPSVDNFRLWEFFVHLQCIFELLFEW